jgi:hypothetical protein
MRQFRWASLLLLLSLGGLQTQSLFTGHTEGKPLFQSESMLEVRIVADFKTLFKDRGEERDYHEGEFYWRESGDSLEQQLPVKLRLRGNFRRKKENCGFPPIRLKFGKDDTKGTLFAGQKKLKLVTHCSNRSAYEQYNLEEYLAYKMYNELTDWSFRVRLLKISYEDAKGKKDPIQRYGFLIEDEDDMAERHGGVILEKQGISQRNIENKQEVLMSLFAYMIGNTDWSVSGQHNVKIIQRGLGDPYVAVPYDFDWCGMISTPYARPNPILGIESVRERVYRGVCQDRSLFDEAIQRFNAEKADIYRLFEQTEGMDPKVRKRALKYLDEFYEIINSENNLRNNVLNQCR